MVGLNVWPGPADVSVHGAGVVQHAVVGPPPLPGGVATVLRFLFNLPQWFQIAGFIVGVLVAIAVLALLWSYRRAIGSWITTRRRQVQLALGALVTVFLLGSAVVGAAGYHYVEHENAFCTGCHIMARPFQRFAGSKHDSLECHTCHQQSMFANMRQLYLWVAERPQEIGPHAKVPTRVCARCHEQGAAKETWQRIASTAGHRTHLQSDSSALRGVQCVTCHGYQVHRFVPVDSTCAQAGCHVTVQIKLAKMRDQTDLHCILCHQFTAEVPALAAYDSARGTLVPGMKQCLGCHEMRAVLAEFDPAKDPHRGQCGDCHNPHTQATPAEAALTCASAKCHADWRSDPFHIGTNHRAVNEKCTLCHEPHHAKVDPSDCAGCHAAVRARRAGKHLTPPLPFDTAAALHRVALRSGLSPGLGPAGHGPFFADPPPEGDPSGGAAAADSFPHDRHKSLACITCHKSNAAHGELTFDRPRGCQICHHQAPQATDCSTCHQASELAPESVSVRVQVAGQTAHEHRALFLHATHTSVKCATCHTTPATLDPAPLVLACAACHDDHHTAGRRCDACHTDAGPDIRAAHAPPIDAHTNCDACHTPTIVAHLVPDRELCLACHPAQRDHHPDRECTPCHFQASPDAFAQHLRRAPAGS